LDNRRGNFFRGVGLAKDLKSERNQAWLHCLARLASLPNAEVLYRFHNEKYYRLLLRNFYAKKIKVFETSKLIA
jgi:hypothetical protein